MTLYTVIRCASEKFDQSMLKGLRGGTRIIRAAFVRIFSDAAQGIARKFQGVAGCEG